MHVDWELMVERRSDSSSDKDWDLIILLTSLGDDWLVMSQRQSRAIVGRMQKSEINV